MDYEFIDIDSLVWRRAEKLSEETGLEINIVHYIRGNERYVFYYSDGNERKCLSSLKKLAKNPKLSFTTYDAKVLSNKLIEEYEKKEREGERFGNSKKDYSFDSEGLDSYLSKEDFSGD